MKKIAGVLALLLIWQVGSTMTTPLFVPSPMSVLEALVGLVKTGQLLPGLAYSFSRITIAALLSMSLIGLNAHTNKARGTATDMESSAAIVILEKE